VTKNLVHAIRMRDVSFAYAEVDVLRDVNMVIGAGEFSAIVGPNGGGKTTLVKLILGLVEPARGTTEIFGHPPPRFTRRIGYMPQHPHLDAAFPVTVLDVVMMGCLGGNRFGPPPRRARLRGIESLREVGCENLQRRAFGALSTGQQQRALLARALVTEPELLILDEPTANLDPSIQDDLYELLHRLNQRMTVIVVSHDVAFVSKYVTRVVCVNRDVVLHPTKDVTSDMLSALYGRGGVRLVDHGHHAHDSGDH